MIWNIMRRPVGYAVVKLYPTTYEHICIVDGIGIDHKAVANLIASTPELLEALKKLVAEYEESNPQVSGADDSDIHQYPQSIVDAIKAIRKAERIAIERPLMTYEDAHNTMKESAKQNNAIRTTVRIIDRE